MINILIKELLKHNKIIILRHIFPDLDAIGSQMGLYQFIKDNFSDKEVLVSGHVPPEYSSIGLSNDLKKEDYKNALVIITDTPITSRIDIKDINYLKEAKTIFKIDHHINVENFADVEIVDDSYPATCELLTVIFNSKNYIFSNKTAYYLFHGLVTDTDRFLYRNVTSRTFEAASILMNKKIDINKIYNNIYSLEDNYLRMKGYILCNYVLTQNNLAYIIIDKKILDKYKIKNPHQVSLWVNILGELKSAKIWIFFVQNDNHIRVEFRSSKYSVREIAIKYGGGGHKSASGAKVKDFIECQKIISYCNELLKNNQN
ncbi:phosphoesterase RecJ domain-containing protein [Spiroplasma litorale]|uniref:Phosphoesterase RecJ domain-containing protein n=1 Tax=Spiroplasma litorale TaxID=216942 RepID=A0A0K1W1J7_9MOLU|nr:bifunctional oligoribonuclease/PAP phosphatase NrnA [Spiroplasma litorale]AKX34056.1 phosphoesterase RecJ domain-containing protein [Spiroplasma litorale]